MKLFHQLSVLSSISTSTLAGWRGTNIVKAAQQPDRMLQIFDREGSPQCRNVREALTAMGLDAEICPCPIGGTRFSEAAGTESKAVQVPTLVDPNTDTTLSDPVNIVAYLFQTYGGMETPRPYRPQAHKVLLGKLGSAVRSMRGLYYRNAKRPEQRLELWSFESSPYSRLVRERLTELEIPYVLHNIGKEQFADLGPAAMRVKPGPYKPRPGGRREKLLAQLGRVQVPYLEDPNTGVKLYESRKIIAYLEREYAI